MLFWYNPLQETVVVDVIIEPAHEGFEKTLQVAYGLSSDELVRANGTPKNIFHLAMLADMVNMKLSGLMSNVGGGLLRLLACVAYRLSKHQDFEKYCLYFLKESHT